jgi:hypothetical protein
MAKVNNAAAAVTSNLSVEKINDGIYAMAIGAEMDMQIDRNEAFDFFEKADNKSFETLGGGQYLNWEEKPQGTYVFIFTGTTSWVDNSPQGGGKTVTAVKLEDKEGNEWICAAKLIVENLSRVQVMPTMCRVIYGGKKKSKSGNNFFDLSVQVGRGALAPANDGNSFQM